MADAQQDHAAAIYAHSEGLELHVYGSRTARSFERPQVTPTGVYAPELARPPLT